MDFEKLTEIIEGMESLNDWRHFGPKSRKKIAKAYAFSLLAAFPMSLCFPSEQAMICQPPSHSGYLEVFMTSASSMHR